MGKGKPSISLSSQVGTEILLPSSLGIVSLFSPYYLRVSQELKKSTLVLSAGLK